MPEISEAELKKQIDSRNFERIYLLYGEEKYLVDVYSKKLIAKAAGDVFLDFNLQRFDGSSASVDDIADAVQALPFMAERKCVAVSDFNPESRSAQDMEKFSELLENIPDTTVLVLFLPSVIFEVKKSAKWRNFISAVGKIGGTVCLKKRSGADLEKLLCTAASKRFCSLSRQDAARIIFLCGDDLQTLYQELEKLCSYVGDGEITREIIDLVVVKNMETTVFLLSKALISGDYDKAYSLMDILFYQNEDPVSILAVLSSAYIDMYRVKASLQSGKTFEEPAKYFEYKGKEFRLKNAEKDGRRLSIGMLRDSLNVLLETDLALKSARISNRILLEKLVAKLLLIAEKERIN